LLPSRVPHAPQRPVENSMGLVIERKRDDPGEKDGLRWYVDFEKCEGEFSLPHPFF
jgi:3-hydroxyanthranilate 3,4-dioxygenase